MLPKMDGFEVCERLKKNDPQTKKIPIIMLTAKGEEEDVIKGQVGADDYITKPFSPKVLLARIKLF